MLKDKKQNFMKLQILQENFSKALNIACRLTISKIQLPILTNVLLKTSKNKLLVVSTNLEMSVSIPIGAKVEKEGEITIPARTITELISNLTPGPINLSAEKEILKISAANFESSISGINAAEFPVVPHDVGTQNIKISSENFLDALNTVLFAVSTDETRPVLTGVLVIIRKNELLMVATDGFRLSQKKIKIEGFKEEKKVIIPKNALSEILRLGPESGTIDFSFKEKENQVIFAVSDTVLATRVIDGDFPDYERIIPKTSRLKVSLDREEFLRAIKLASVFAKEAANVVKLNAGGRYLEVSAESSQSGSQITKVDAKSQGLSDSDTFLIAFNFRFLEDFLNATSTEEVAIEFSDPNAPALFIDTSDKEYLHVIMPVRLQGSE